MMPIHHIHIAMILALAFVTACAVYLYLATGKSDSGPLKIAGIVLLAILVVNSAVYISFYSFFAVLLYIGNEIYRVAPPMPEQVVTTNGETLFTRNDLETGRQVWQSMGGMQVGSI